MKIRKLASRKPQIVLPADKLTHLAPNFGDKIKKNAEKYTFCSKSEEFEKNETKLWKTMAVAVYKTLEWRSLEHIKYIYQLPKLITNKHGVSRPP